MRKKTAASVITSMSKKSWLYLNILFILLVLALILAFYYYLQQKEIAVQNNRLAASDSRNNIASATSLGSPGRPIGSKGVMRSRRPGS